MYRIQPPILNIACTINWSRKYSTITRKIHENRKLVTHNRTQIKTLLFFEVSFEWKFFSASVHLPHETIFLFIVMHKIVPMNVEIIAIDPSVNNNGNPLNWHLLKLDKIILNNYSIKIY